MFYQFFVKEEHRDFLKFFWYKDNNPDLSLIEYRMCVHVFGNSPSPAVATYGLRRIVSTYDTDVKEFVDRNFYVDDGLISRPTSSEVTSLMKRTQEALKCNGGIRLHKIISNRDDVMSAFPAEDLNKDLKCLNLKNDYLPLQHSLGLSWDLNTDSFIFDISISEKPFTRRGLLSSLNSIFDPIGFLAPVTISGKIMLREASPSGTNWDEPLPKSHQTKWIEWIRSLELLSNLVIPRMYTTVSVSLSKITEIHIFSDASEKAVAAVAFIKTEDPQRNESYTGFLMGKSKLAPRRGHTIPRLELCGAVLATEVGETVLEHLDIAPVNVKYYTDSKVVLGYINNSTRRFYTNVSNRVDRILKASTSAQWNFVPTHLNPADCGTRCSVSYDNISESPWLIGPKWFHSKLMKEYGLHSDDSHPLVDPDEDAEVRPHVDVMKTSVISDTSIGSNRFERFSSWRKLVRSVSFLRHLALSFRGNDENCRAWHFCSKYRTVDSYRAAETFILREVQKEIFSQEIKCLSERRNISKNSTIMKLSPFLDENGLLRVGGRLNKVQHCLPAGEINPIILPKGHHVSLLLVQFYHESVRHQGRVLTEGALRKNGHWFVGAKRMICSLISKCVTCRKLRGKFSEQKMADLPEDRLIPGPPFTSVGVDTFGPWEVVTRKTRGGVAQSKRWAILFSCLTTRAVHIEVVEEMSSSSFINALRRFESLRGPVQLYRSDRETNFVGATDDLKIDTVNVEDGHIQTYLYNSGTIWKFNAPHSSHMGGAWERMIGITRGILDSIMLNTGSKKLTHECLTTFMAEVCAIMNSRPLAEISSDPDSPLVLSPSMLLTGKLEHLPVISDSLSIRDLYRAQWKHVQILSDLFWKMWRKNYLQNLQVRRKWFDERQNLKVGDVVLLKDDVHRNMWPLGIIEKTIESCDHKVRKACLRVFKDGRIVRYTRPISEMILLID